MGKVLVVRLKEGSSRGPGCYEYKNDVNGEDFRQVALILLDLESQGIPMNKAILEFRRLKEKGSWPFD